MDSPADTGHMEDSPADTSPPMDSSVMPETGPDAPVDAPADTSTVPETGTDASDGAGPLVPCTTAGQTNCVKCDGQTTGICTPTEAIIVQYDIDKGLVTAPGPEPMTACYECMTGFMAGCLDDSIGDHGRECEDPLTSGTADQCRATLQCILNTNCAAVAVSTCYCGTAGVATSCHGNPAPGPINGACATQIATGMGYPVSDGTDITNHLTDPTHAAGMAVELLYCAQNSTCTSCFM
jgi:hypothetical protein